MHTRSLPRVFAHGVPTAAVWAPNESLAAMLIQEPHDVRLPRIELEAFDLNLQFFRREPALNFAAAELGGDTGFRPRIYPPSRSGIAVARSINGSCLPASQFFHSSRSVLQRPRGSTCRRYALILLVFI
jgi:hypothetical protein